MNAQQVGPKVGIGVLIFKGKKILLGKRTGSHGADTWAPPGGHLEFRESFENCAVREVKEETGLDITSPEFLAVTNDIFEEENKHYVTIFMVAQHPEGQAVENLEPQKTTSWDWFDIKSVPDQLFLPLNDLLSGEGRNVLLEIADTNL